MFADRVNQRQDLLTNFLQKTITRAGNPLNKYTYVENWPSGEKLEESRCFKVSSTVFVFAALGTVIKLL